MKLIFTLFVLLNLFGSCWSSVVWACSGTDVNNDKSCMGLLSLGLNGQVQLVSDLSNQGYDKIIGTAIDSSSQVAYVFLGYEGNQTLSYASVDLVSGKVISLLTNTWTLDNDEQFLDIYFNSKSLYALVGKQGNIPSLSSINVEEIAVSSGEVINTLISLPSEFNIFISSAYDNSTNTFYSVFANESGFQFFSFDLNSGNSSQWNSQNQIFGLTYDSNDKQVLGTVSLSPPGSNSFVLVNPKTHQVTVLNSASPFQGPTCGIVSHSGYDYSGSSYFTICCEDQATCSNLWLARFSIPTGNILMNVTLSYEQTPISGLFIS